MLLPLCKYGIHLTAPRFERVSGGAGCDDDIASTNQLIDVTRNANVVNIAAITD